MFDPIICIIWPLLGALASLLIKPGAPKQARVIFLTGMLAVNLAFSVAVWHNLPDGQLPELITLTNIGAPAAFRFRADALAMSLVILNNFICLLCAFYAGSQRFYERRGFSLQLAVLCGAVNGAFLADDLLLFYICFEATLLPLFLIVTAHGGAGRSYAAMKLFLFTLLGSVPMLVTLAYLYAKVGSLDPALISKAGLSWNEQMWLRGAFMLAFAVKLPLWPLHTWLPDAHTEAPTVGSVLLAAVMLKIGGYGMLRFNDTLFPAAAPEFAGPVALLSVAAVIAASAAAFAQTDIKKLIAYSSVAHMGYVTLALSVGGILGRQAALYQMISHGFVSAGLFFMIGMFYERFHTREAKRYGGLAAKMPKAAALFMLFTFANIGLPGTSGFIGEFNALVAAYEVFPTLTALAATGVIFSAAYGLRLYRVMMFESEGSAVKEYAASDLYWYEWLTLIGLAASVLWFGINAQPLMYAVEGALRGTL